MLGNPQQKCLLINHPLLTHCAALTASDNTGLKLNSSVSIYSIANHSMIKSCLLWAGMTLKTGVCGHLANRALPMAILVCVQDLMQTQHLSWTLLRPGRC